MNLVRRGVIPQLILIILPLSLLLLIIPFISLALHQQAMRELVGERDERTVRSVAKAIGEQLDHRLASVRSLAVQAATATPSELLSTADYLLMDFEGGLAIYSANGDLLAARGEQSIPHDMVLQVIPQFNGEPTFSRPFANNITNEQFMLAMHRDSGIVIVGSFSVTHVIRDTLVDAFLASESGTAFVTDQDRHVIYQTGATPLNKNLSEHPGVHEALDGQSGTTYIQQTDSIMGEHVVAYSPISPVNWTLVIEESWEHVDNPLLRATQFAPLVLIPPLLLAVLALWFGIHQIVRPLQTLATKAAQLGSGHYEAIEQSVGGVAEIQRLQTELVLMAHKVEAAQGSLHDYINAITTGQEEERRRLARELHDDTLQALIALNQRIQLAKLSLTEASSAAQINEIQALAEQTIANLRRVARALRPIYLEDLGLVTALEMLTREISTVNLKIQFQRIGQERRLSAETELSLYRMAQEALNNVVRHAKATSALLMIHFKHDTISLHITDNGHGFKIPETPVSFAQQGHFGLLGLHERADLIGASLAIRSSLTEGTQITVTLTTPT